MTEPSAIDAASNGLRCARCAGGRGRASARGRPRRAALDAQVHALGTDRSRLASDLDARRRARARSKPPTARSRSGSMPRSTPSARCSRRRALRDVNVRRRRPCRRSTSPSTAASSAWPARTARRSICSVSPQDLDERIVALRDAFGEIGDTRLTVMAALTVADELAETEGEAAAAGGGAGRPAGRARRLGRTRAGDAGGGRRRAQRGGRAHREHHQAASTRRSRDDSVAMG